MDFGDLQLSLDTDAGSLGVGSGVAESWAVIEDGSMRHHKTGILIGELGLRDGNTEFTIDKDDIEVDQLSLLGRGAGGVVARGVHKPSNTPLAVKVVRVEDKAKRSQLIHELETLLGVTKSHFLIQLYAAYIHKETGCVHVALEYMDYGSLADLKQRTHMVPENMLAMMMMQILEGLKTLHLSYVVHRDVKLGNILVNSRGNVKVTDFGIAKTLGDTDVCDTFVGTATHMSPERVLGEDYSFAADIWSLGLVCFELASGAYPYGSVTSFPVLFDNLCNKQEPRLTPGKFSPGLCEFVELQLQRKPERRATAIQLQAHKWILASMFQVKEGELVRWLAQVMQDKDR